MPQEPFSRPQPQYWIKFLDPWMQDFYPVLGFRIGRTQLFLTPALDKNRCPRQMQEKIPGKLFMYWFRARGFVLFLAVKDVISCQFTTRPLVVPLW